MRVLFVAWGQVAHYFHMVPLAWAFRAAGHDVRVAVQPVIADAVVRSGMAVVPVGADYDFRAGTFEADGDLRRGIAYLRQRRGGRERAPRSLADVRAAAAGVEPAGSGAAAGVEPAGSPGAPWAGPGMTPRAGSGTAPRAGSGMTPLVRAATAMAGDLVGLARAWRPDLVVADPLVLAAPLAAEACGATLVHHLWGPAMARRMALLGSGSGMTWPAELRELYDRYGVRPRAEPAVASVDGCPASLQYRDIPQRVPMRYVPYNGSDRLPDWLVQPAGRPRICVTWGTLSYDTLGLEGFAVPRVVEALAGFDAEVVVTVGEAERALLGDPPPGMRFVSNVPLSDLLPGCAAVVHQGGAGTMLTAAAAGVPQVAVTVLPAHVLNARRLAGTGAGVVLDVAQADRATVAAAVAAALSDQRRRAAGRLRAEIIAQPTPAEVVGTLADLVGAHGERAG